MRTMWDARFCKPEPIEVIRETECFYIVEKDGWGGGKTTRRISKDVVFERESEAWLHMANESKRQHKRYASIAKSHMIRMEKQKQKAEEAENNE